VEKIQPNYVLMMTFAYSSTGCPSGDGVKSGTFSLGSIGEEHKRIISFYHFSLSIEEPLGACPLKGSVA
jgi:hypothetical protein